MIPRVDIEYAFPFRPATLVGQFGTFAGLPKGLSLSETLHG